MGRSPFTLALLSLGIACSASAEPAAQTMSCVLLAPADAKAYYSPLFASPLSTEDTLREFKGFVQTKYGAISDGRVSGECKRVDDQAEYDHLVPSWVAFVSGHGYRAQLTSAPLQ